MKNLFLLDGAAGSGKSDFFDFINEVGAQMSNFAIALPKYTSREQRAKENKVNDLYFFEGDREDRYKKYRAKIDEIQKKGDFVYEYQYPKSEAYYAIPKSSIDEALKKYKNVYIIIRSSYCIRMIMDTYKNFENLNIIPIFIYSDKDCVEQRIRNEMQLQYSSSKLPEEEVQKIIEEKIKIRLSRTNIAMNDYYTQPTDIYKEIIINNSNKVIYFRQMRALLEKYNEFKGLPNRAFIIMPMDSRTADEHTENISVKNAIFLGAKEAGIIASRSDDIIDNNSQIIIQKVYQNIDDSQICIVDLTKNRPNCYLELGYARAKNKKVILIAAKEDDENPYIHFDEQGYNCYYYDTSREGLHALRIHIQQEIAMWKKTNLI